MSLTTILVYAAIAAAQPPAAQPVLGEVADDRTPIRCKPAPYYVAEQGNDRIKPERLMVTGSRVPITARDYDRKPRPPCLLMRYEAPANPLRVAD